jgi:ADP-ribosylglycohydrolase
VEPGGRDWLEDRIRGCLGVAVLGDVVGAPFEGCTQEEARTYGDPLPHVWSIAAEATDDTGQLEALARVLVESHGKPTEEGWRAALLHWYATSPTAERAGPTTRALLEGRDPAEDKRIGVTNGSAMRAAPCGLVHPGDPEAAVELAWFTSRHTHDTQVAAAAAGAIAAGVAVALRPGAGLAEVVEACVLGAALGNGLGVRHGRTVALPRVSSRIELAIGEARAARDMNEALERIEAAVGTSMLAFESVPAAVGVLAASDGDPFDVVRAAVRLGGDTDTIASMAGALAGALHGYAAVEPEDRAVVDLVLPGLGELVPGLAAIAAERPAPGTPP